MYREELQRSSREVEDLGKWMGVRKGVGLKNNEYYGCVYGKKGRIWFVLGRRGAFAEACLTPEETPGSPPYHLVLRGLYVCVIDPQPAPVCVGPFYAAVEQRVAIYVEDICRHRLYYSARAVKRSF